MQQICKKKENLAFHSLAWIKKEEFHNNINKRKKYTMCYVEWKLDPNNIENNICEIDK